MDIQEIREGVAKVLYGELTYQNYLTIPKLRQDADLKIDKILSYLAEKDACFPVEGELPETILDKTYQPKEASAKKELLAFHKGYGEGCWDMLQANYKKVITLKEMMGGD